MLLEDLTAAASQLVAVASRAEAIVEATPFPDGPMPVVTHRQDNNFTSLMKRTLGNMPTPNTSFMVKILQVTHPP